MLREAAKEFFFLMDIELRSGGGVKSRPNMPMAIKLEDARGKALMALPIKKNLKKLSASLTLS